MVLVHFLVMRPKLKLQSMSYTREDILDRVEEAHLEGNGNARRRLQVVLHAFSGRLTTDEIAELVGCSRASVTSWVKRWREGGFYSLLKNNYKPTRSPSLNDEMVDDLIHHLSFGLIHGDGGRGIQKWLKDRYNVELTLTGVDYWFYRIQDMAGKPGFDFHKNPPENPYLVDVEA